MVRPHASVDPARSTRFSLRLPSRSRGWSRHALQRRHVEGCKPVATPFADDRDMTTRHTRTPANKQPDSTEPVQRLLDAISAGTGIPDGLFTADALLDATVPMWRYETTGAPAVQAELARWYGAPTRVEHVRRRPFPGGEAVEIDISWVEGGVPHAGHQLHVLALSDDRITSDTVFCGGRWPADLLAEMEAARAH